MMQIAQRLLSIRNIIGLSIALAGICMVLQGSRSATDESGQVVGSKNVNWSHESTNDQRSNSLPNQDNPEAVAVDEQEFSQQQIEHFEQVIRPILVDNCFECHGAEEIEAGLNVTHRAGLLEGGDSGPAIDFEDPEYSLLMEVINYESYEMPPSGKLSDEQIQLLTDWVADGAPWTPGDTGVAAHEATELEPEVNETTKSFWSYQPVVRPELPTVRQVDWISNEIDRFVLARLEQNGLSPNSIADRQTLIRRVTYDLTGLPPTPEEVREFVADHSPDAYESLVDRLLASPHYGEKWGRHWLDLVRYAETNSYERDGAKPFVWRYRDYVIRSFNQDKPYDQFIIEQLAGDELETPTPESIVATGFYRLGRWDDEPADPKQAYYDGLDDILTTTTQSFLGMTVNCARCHDHKIDPVPQTDYYRFIAFFDNIQHYGIRGHDTVLRQSVREIATEEERSRFDEETTEHQEQLSVVNAGLEELESKVKEDFIPVEIEEFKHEMNRVPLMRKRVPDLITQEELDEYIRLTEQRNHLRRHPPASLAQALCVTEKGADPAETFVFIRGSAHAPGDPVEPGFPSVLSPPEPVIEAVEGRPTSGRRLALAKWIASAENPLTARVAVNRIWQHHFGNGIVASTSDFGFQGTPPTHPILLDWLASEFVESGWSIKAMHKLILMSSTYRMSSQGNDVALEKDPANQLLWRFNMRRLTAEEIRDSVLAINGSLNRESMYGPSIYTIIPGEVLAGQSRPGSGWGRSSEEDMDRRSIYIHVKRSLVEPTLEVFDFADTDTTCPVRFATTQPTQALAMMNSEFINREGEVLANFVSGIHPGDATAQVKLAYGRATQREPSDQEIQMGLDLIEAFVEQDEMSEAQALKFYCVLVFNLNEFLYVD